MAQKDDLRKEFLKMKREYTEKVRSKGINEFKKEKLNSKDVEMLVLKFQMGKYDSLIIYVDKDIKKIIQWYNLLIENAIITIEDLKEESEDQKDEKDNITEEDKENDSENADKEINE